MSEVHFVGIDGESDTVNRGKPNEDHRYTLLAACGDGIERYAYDGKGLSTVRCFEFILDLPPKITLVGFGWSYDVNMMLKDVPLKVLVQLWKTGDARWKGYSLMWIPGKFMNIRSGKRSKRIYDVFGFFQSSFVVALKKWGFTPQGEMESMKKQRSAFDSTMKEAIIEYCLDECYQAASLMDELHLALTEVGLGNVKNWIGAGAIASELMKRHHVDTSHTYDYEFNNEEITDEIRRAYYGGRVELFKQGEFPKLWDYDIISAYPSKAIGLPDLANGTWKELEGYDEKADWAIYDTEWSLATDTILSPFPVRRSGSIYYPRNGRGTYHGVEVKAAKEIYGDEIKVLRGWQFVPASDKKPFDWVPVEFEHRRKLKAEGHAGEKCLKLGLNSIYGKLAQGAGYGDKPPPFQSYFWSGYITAATRAAVLDVAGTGIESLVMIATDGIFFDKDPLIPEQPGLGGLELDTMSDCFVAQPGIYSHQLDGEIVGRCRGFFSREINFADLKAGWEKDGFYHVAQFDSTRFIGLGTALLTKDMDSWRTWKRSKRKLSLYPNRKFIVNETLEENEHGRYYRHYPSSMNVDHVSEIYTPKPGFATMTDEELEGAVEHIQGTEQPLKEF